MAARSLKLLSQQLAQQIDIELMSSEGGFLVEQLMELAGLGCAEAIFKVYGKKKILICCGPGNNGGDGLVAARHLKHFGATTEIYYPKPTTKPLFEGLIVQNKNLGNKFITSEITLETLSKFDVVVDAIFGFSFSFGSGLRSPFDHVLKVLRASPVPIVSIDIPSGWDVERGDVFSVGVNPSMVVSLTAPKLCARFFPASTLHVLAGRFVPLQLDEKYGLGLPVYPGTDQSMDISSYASTWNHEQSVF